MSEQDTRAGRLAEALAFRRWFKECVSGGYKPTLPEVYRHVEQRITSLRAGQTEQETIRTLANNEADARHVESIIGLSTVLTAINSDRTREALWNAVKALRGLSAPPEPSGIQSTLLKLHESISSIYKATEENSDAHGAYHRVLLEIEKASAAAWDTAQPILAGAVAGSGDSTT